MAKDGCTHQIIRGGVADVLIYLLIGKTMGHTVQQAVIYRGGYIPCSFLVDDIYGGLHSNLKTQNCITKNKDLKVVSGY